MEPFFFSNNPIALFLALVLTIATLKVLLSNHKWFKGSKSPFVIPVIIIAGLMLLFYSPLLEIVSFAAPFIALLAILVFFLGAMYVVLGMKEDGMWRVLKGIGPLKTGLQIAVICIIALAVSRVYGDKLLEEPSVSITDPLIAPEEPIDIDFAPVFTKQALGMAIILIVMAFGMFFVNFAK